MRLLATCAMIGVSLAASTPATAGGSAVREAAAPSVYSPRVRGVGCYWERGNLYCSRYCYIEVNNRQYCQARLRDAVPQGQVLVVENQRLRPYRRGAKD